MSAEPTHPLAFKFYGSATVGPKGQVVIPADARATMGLKPGDKVLIIGKGDKMVGVCSADHIESLLEHISGHLSTLREALNREKKEAE